MATVEAKLTGQRVGDVAYFWKHGFGTLDIAMFIGASEPAVYNTLDVARSKGRKHDKRK
jgi:hypothetical protein